jgi:hypothetical protein
LRKEAMARSAVRASSVGCIGFTPFLMVARQSVQLTKLASGSSQTRC